MKKGEVYYIEKEVSGFIHPSIIKITNTFLSSKEVSFDRIMFLSTNQYALCNNYIANCNTFLKKKKKQISKKRWYKLIRRLNEKR